MRTIPFLILWRTALRDSEVGHLAKLVGYTLATHMDGNGGSCFPGLTLVAREASISERSARKAIRELETAGLVRTARGGGRSSGGYYSSNRYWAVLPDRHQMPHWDDVARQEMSEARHAESSSPAPNADEGVSLGRSIQGVEEARHTVPGCESLENNTEHVLQTDSNAECLDPGHPAVDDDIPF